MIIVSDSGPLAYLVSIGIADSLPQLYGEVYIPPAVLAELRNPRCPVAAWANDLPGWLRTATPHLVPTELRLDAGECEAIGLALELGADRVLMDERQGRQAARSVGLKVAGTLAVILDGAAQGLFDGDAAIEQLARTNFYAGAELLDRVRELLKTNPPKP